MHYDIDFDTASPAWRKWRDHFDERKDAPPNGWRAFLSGYMPKYEWFARYNLYLRSWAWIQRRSGVLKREQMCQLCQSTERLEVHHVTYQRVGAEGIEDLRCLCFRCHKDVERRGDKWVPMSPSLRAERDRRRHIREAEAKKKKVTRRRPKPPEPTQAE